MTEEKYGKVIELLKQTTCYKPGDILEEKVINNIKKKKRFSMLYKSIILIAGISIISLVYMGIDKPKNEVFTQNNTTPVLKEFEPIYDITLVSDGF
ncbi:MULTISPECIES: hypothetical protein [unclassified Thermosipho (in: thermotogales)]|uniref:hypothetical protein n=1 Tax=unclassified Thermosipho (in: thermotogales) TaxID=2676525 RepID=UPI0009864DB8|nr:MULTISPECIES: hypothetical protein [unclassified Thermosipho (in: thermotogales)]MBT1247072.1 hypothetical protein [Thermosipho sp. 1244]OOC46872.1 hypothetical protein XO09_04625 [Thermosipho sp. 1223]